MSTILYHGRHARLSSITPTRVLQDAEGKAIPFSSEMPPPVAIFERSDGWRLAIHHKDLKEAAESLWEYVGMWWLLDTDNGGPEYVFAARRWDQAPAGTVDTEKYGRCTVMVGYYAAMLHCVAISLVGAKDGKYPGEPIATVSAYVEGADTQPGEFCVPFYNLGQGLMDDILAAGFFEDTGRKVPSGHVELPVWRCV